MFNGSRVGGGEKRMFIKFRYFLEKQIALGACVLCALLLAGCSRSESEAEQKRSQENREWAAKQAEWATENAKQSAKIEQGLREAERSLKEFQDKFHRTQPAPVVPPERNEEALRQYALSLAHEDLRASVSASYDFGKPVPIKGAHPLVLNAPYPTEAEVEGVAGKPDYIDAFGERWWWVRSPTGEAPVWWKRSEEIFFTGVSPVMGASFDSQGRLEKVDVDETTVGRTADWYVSSKRH